MTLNTKSTPVVDCKTELGEKSKRLYMIGMELVTMSFASPNTSIAITLKDGLAPQLILNTLANY